MSTHTHILQLERRTVTLRITEFPDSIRAEIESSPKLRPPESPAERELLWRLLAPLFKPYNDDPRPLVMPNPFTGQTAVLTGNAHHCTTTLVPILPPPRPSTQSATPEP